MAHLLDLEVFVVHLAAQLVGPEVVRESAEEAYNNNNNNGFRLYWRLPLQLQLTHSGDASTSANGSIIFVDATFEFAWRKDESKNDSSIRMRFGSMIKRESDGDAARYCTAPTVTVDDLERHFRSASIDTASTPAPVLAKSMVVALKHLAATAGTTTTTSTTTALSEDSCIPLFYPDVGASATLVIGGSTSHTVAEPVLTMLLLHHTTFVTATNVTLHAARSNAASSTPTDAEIATLSDYILQQWKPQLMNARSQNSQQAQSTATAVSASDAIAPTLTNVGKPADSAGNAAAGTTATNKPAAVVRNKRTHGYQRITSKKVKTGKLKYAG
jgi:hypothetical protein